MSLSAALSFSVPAKVRERGAACLRDGLVKLTLCTGDRVEATVSGTQKYLVTLVRDRKTVEATCSCPYFCDRGEICKHLWATVLAADPKGGLRGPRGGLPGAIFADLPWEDDRELDDFLEDELPQPGFRTAHLPPPPRRPALPPAPRAPGWREALAPLAAPAPVPAAYGGEILYVLDLPGSLQRQALIFEIQTFRRQQNGSRGPLKPLRLRRGQISALQGPADREVVFLLAGAASGDPWSYYSSDYAEIPSRAVVPDELAPELARRICATGRCHLRTGPGQMEEQPLRFEDGPPWELWLAVHEEAGGRCQIVPELRLGDSRVDAREVNLLPRAGLLLTRDVMARIDVGEAGAWRWLQHLRQANPLRVPAKDREDFLAALLSAADLPRLDLPAALRFAEVTAEPRPRLRLVPPSGRLASYRDWPEARVSYLYEDHEVDAGSPGGGVYVPEGRRLLRRDRAAEGAALERLAALGFREDAAGAGDPIRRTAPSRVPETVRTLLAEGWSVEAQGKLYRSAGRFEINVASGIDWFELHGTVEFAGEAVGLPQLLAALRRGDGFVPLRDGSLGLLPEEWMKRWAPLAALGQAEGDHLRFTAPQAVLLDAWLAEEPAVTCDETFARARERLRGFSGIAPAAAPAGFCGTLRPYQEAGLGWLQFLEDFGLGGCLADDMGLGKTVQVLALLEARRARHAKRNPPLPPSLVVVPRSLVFNWLAEAERFAPALRFRDYTGADRTQDSSLFTGCDVVLATYGTLRRDIGTLKEAAFDYVILDEAQAIKNANSQTAKAARLLGGRHRLAVTGTPVENHLGELWSLLEFLNPGFLGASGGSKGGSKLGRDPGPEAREALSRALRPLILRRTKEQVAPDLPARVEQTLFCELPAKQRRLYDELRDYYRKALDKRIGAQGLGRSQAPRARSAAPPAPGGLPSGAPRPRPGRGTVRQARSSAPPTR